MASETDWLIRQLEAWPARVDPEKTTNITFLMRTASREICLRRAVVAELVECLRPFVDLGPQKGAWGVISKKLDDFAPMTVTVTKAQMLAACNAVHRHQAGLGKGDEQ